MGNQASALQNGSRPDIFGYHDYRAFLESYLIYLGEVEPELSRREIARRAEMGSGYLPMVLSGHRKLSTKAMDKMIPHLKFSQSEETYFRLLVELEESEDVLSQQRALKRLQKFSSYRKLNAQEMEAYRYLTHWYYVAIREMAGLPGFKLDPKWIQKRLGFKVPLKEVSDAVEFLKEHGFIEVDRGKVKISAKSVDCEHGVYRVALGSFHREMLMLTADAIESVPRKERDLSAHALSISRDQFPEVVDILREARSRIEALGKRNPSQNELVYYVGLTAIPLSRTEDDEEQEDGHE